MERYGSFGVYQSFEGPTFFNGYVNIKKDFTILVLHKLGLHVILKDGET